MLFGGLVQKLRLATVLLRLQCNQEESSFNAPGHADPEMKGALLSMEQEYNASPSAENSFGKHTGCCL